MVKNKYWTTEEIFPKATQVEGQKKRMPKKNVRVRVALSNAT